MMQLAAVMFNVCLANVIATPKNVFVHPPNTVTLTTTRAKIVSCKEEAVTYVYRGVGVGVGVVVGSGNGWW